MKVLSSSLVDHSSNDRYSGNVPVDEDSYVDGFDDGHTMMPEVMGMVMGSHQHHPYLDLLVPTMHWEHHHQQHFLPLQQHLPSFALSFS